MATFKIKLEDKAAFLNRMEKAGAGLDTDQAVDNKLEGYFEVTVDEPKQIEAVNTILKQSPKITQMESKKKKMTKDELKEMVRQELQSVLAEKKKAKDEDKKDKLDENEEVSESLFADAAPILATLLGVGGSLAAAIISDLRKAKTPEEKKQVLQSIAGQITKSKGL
jgi:flagellar hook-basal body complex protein FliE